MGTELDKDVASLKQDLRKFRDDLSGIMSNAGHYSQDKVRQTKEKLNTAMRDFENLASQKISHAGEVVREKTQKGVDASREAVTKRPLAAVAVTFAAGLLTAMFMKRRRHEQS